MLSMLARNVGVALLIVAVVTAPVWGSMPRCCRTGAIAGGGNCCCGPNRSLEQADNATEEVRSCCAEKHRPTVVEDARPESARPATARPLCCCKASAPAPAVPPANAQMPALDESLSLDTIINQTALTAPAAIAEVAGAEREDPLKLPLRKIYCRWTV
ncbi:MAG: hypothetical protein WDZ48_04190 [Pirellulales bacterium]